METAATRNVTSFVERSISVELTVAALWRWPTCPSECSGHCPEHRTRQISNRDNIVYSQDTGDK